MTEVYSVTIQMQQGSNFKIVIRDIEPKIRQTKCVYKQGSLASIHICKNNKQPLIKHVQSVIMYIVKILRNLFSCTLNVLHLGIVCP